MIAQRYAIPVAVLLALALIPTTIHSYLNLTKDDGVSVKTINPRSDSLASSLSKRNASYGEEVFGSSDWLERNYSDPRNTRSLSLFIVKGYDHKRLYHHPELAISYGKDLRSSGKIRLPSHPDLTIHRLDNESRTIHAAYALLYDGKFISDPIRHQLLDSLNLLISARKPMVLFYVADNSSAQSSMANEATAETLLTQAIADYQAKALNHR
jgi:hypothetical protein